MTIASRSFAAQNMESEFVDGQEFAAQYLLADAGASGVTPSTVVAVPLLVNWWASDGSFPLYNYDLVNGFVPADGVVTTGHATIAADGSSIQLDGASSPVLVTTAAGVTVGELYDTLPTDLLQLQFYFGTMLLAVLDTTGLFARVVSEGPLPGVAGFQLEYETMPVAVLYPGQCAALAWTVTN